MDLSGFIAGRYLFARKSHNVIYIISGISAAGIAIGCAALVIILSIYNGFDGIVRSFNNSYTPDLLVSPSAGKVFAPSEEFLVELRSAEGVRTVCGVIEENVYLKYGERNAVATAKGVDSSYCEVTGLTDFLVEGEFELEYGQLREAVIGRTLALELGLRTSFLTPLEVYFPSRNEEVSLLDPMASLHLVKLHPAGVLSLEQGFDKKYVFVPISALRELLEYENEVSVLEIYADSTRIGENGVVSSAFQKQVEKLAGEGFTVKNRRQQNEMLYKMLSYEKIAIYLILLFVMIIISFNILGSLSMLRIEKQDDMAILEAMGAENGFINRIFLKESLMISALGIIIGVVVGLLVCFLQQRFGFVKMPGNFVVDAYPVVVKALDILLIIAGVGLIGYITALLAGKTAGR
ncbi:MAG: ABC transporter permease [Bacteroidales bacterium]|nr:ABC transporter permease [Bacteroidales bacterium]